MQISDQTLANTFQWDLTRKQGQLMRAQQKMDMNQRVIKISDDPVAVQQTLGLQSQKRAMTSFSRNCWQARQIMDATDVLLSGYANQVQMRGQEISLIMEGLSPQTDYNDYAIELSQLIMTGVDLLNETYQGDTLLGGDGANMPAFTTTLDSDGAIASVTYAGASTAKSYLIAEGLSFSPQMDPTYSAQLASGLNNLIALKNALLSGDQSAIDTARTAVIGDENLIDDARTVNAVKMMRLDLTESLAKDNYKNLDDQIGRLVDADIFETHRELMQLQAAFEGTIKTGAMIQHLSLLDYVYR